MSVPAWVWVLTVVAFAAMFVVDLLLVDHKPHQFRLREAAAWVSGYVLLAVGFGIVVGAIAGGQYGQEFFAGYITEYALSVDNLFVFVLIMSAFRVPEAFQHKVLLVGILLALVLRGGFIAIGGVVLARFDWVFYLFGAFLVYTAVNLVRSAGVDEEYRDNRAMRLARRVLPITSNPYEGRLVVREGGRRYITPLLLAMFAIGTTDLLFALDSIPAIFGLVKETYLVFAVNAFALMGLRQLFFLLRGLLDRLVYLGYGLAVILGFIGVKLVSETMAHDGVEWAPEISTAVSLVVIVSVLAITAVASLIKSRRDRAKVPATAGQDSH